MKIGIDAKRAFHNNSGLGNYSRDLIRIVSEGIPNDEFLLFNPKESERQFARNSTNTHEIKPKGFWKTFRSAWRSLEIGKIAQAQNLDIYHGLSNELPNQLGPVKSIVTIHDLIFERFPEWYKPIDRKIYRQKFKSAAQRASIVVAISQQTKSDLVDIYNINANKIKVIYQGCHAAFKTKASADVQKRVSEKFGLPKRYLLSVGTIEPRKNLLTIAKAIKDLPKVELVIVGKKTKYAQSVKDYLDQNNMTGRVHFLKGVNMEELAAIYQMATVFGYASQFEGFGIPIIEALFSEVPVITSTGSCFREAGGPDSIYLDYNDTEAWTKSIKKLWDNPGICDDMAQKGKVFATQFEDENILSQWKALYDTFRNS